MLDPQATVPLLFVLAVVLLTVTVAVVAGLRGGEDPMVPGSAGRADPATDDAETGAVAVVQADPATDAQKGSGTDAQKGSGTAAQKDSGTAVADAPAAAVGEAPRPISPDERRRWRERQEAAEVTYAEEPRAGLDETDVLIADLMAAQGMPANSPRQRAASLVAALPDLAGPYETARRHHVATGSDGPGGGQAQTDQADQALDLYRRVIEALLGGDSEVPPG